MSHQYAFASAVEQAAAVAEGTISATELLELTLERLEEFNPALNAVVVTQLATARSAAKQADSRPRVGVERPLHGVPMTIKESWDWQGSASTSGDGNQAGRLLERNSASVQRLLDAGAIIYGKTNLPLKMADWQSFNSIYGTTNNPWDLDRSPGGSSGGAAAALAAGLTALEIGSDIGGSIRNPAHYCGVFGHKPSFGLIPTEGHGFPGTTLSLDLGVGGPMARSVADLRLGLAVMAGPDLAVQQKRRPRCLSSYRVAVMLESDLVAQTTELTSQLTRYLRQVAELGVEVDFEGRPDMDLARAHHVFLTLLRATLGAHSSKSNYRRQQKHLPNWSSGQRDHLAYISYGTTLSHWQWGQYKNEQAEVEALWQKFFSSYDLLLCPAAASAALPHDQSGPRSDRTHEVRGGQESVLDQLFWAGLATLSYLPATVVPAGRVASGLPCGLQIIGPRGGDERCLDFAAELERSIGGFVAPPGYE